MCNQNVNISISMMRSLRRWLAWLANKPKYVMEKIGGIRVRRYVRLLCCIIPNLMNGLDCVLRHKAFVALKVDAMLLYC